MRQTAQTLLWPRLASAGGFSTVSTRTSFSSRLTRRSAAASLATIDNHVNKRIDQARLKAARKLKTKRQSSKNLVSLAGAAQASP